MAKMFAFNKEAIAICVTAQAVSRYAEQTCGKASGQPFLSQIHGRH
jgi:hypothetical protein